MSHPRNLRVLAPVSLAAFVLACGSTSDAPVVRSQGATLERARSCEDLLTRIQDDAIARLDDQIRAYRLYGGPAGAEIGVDSTNSGSGGALAGDVAAPGRGAEDPSVSGGNGSREFSDTNTQVAGVDEADILKTDGERLYLLHGSELFLLSLWPADETRLLGSAPVEGTPFELFVHDGKAIVFSSTHLDLGDDGGAGAPAPTIDCIDCYGGYGTEFTRVSVFDVSGDQPVLERELLFEGHYVSARRHDDVVRVVIQGGFRAPGLFYPEVSTHDAFGRPYSDADIAEQLETWRSRVARDIRATTLEDWVPRRYESSEDGWAELSKLCDGYYVPEPGMVQSGVTQVVAFDLGGAGTPDVVSVLGGAQHVYANQETLLLAHADWRWELGFGEATRTALHRFDVSGDTTPYRASGFIPGYLHNQFSIDERDGVIRLSTTENVRTDPRSPWVVDTVNRVLTVRDVEGALAVLGKTPKMAPGERIYSTRFVGDRGYVVTFRQIDPLFVVDLADPANPTVLGELELPGFSDYMHPLDDDHLLTIGQAGTEDGVLLGVAIRIFDVSNPTQPTLAHEHAYGGSGSSEASYNHKAFTFVPSRGILMFPMHSYEPTYRTELQVVHVDVEAGFTQLGAIEHSCTADAGSVCDGYGYGTEMRRGLLIEDSVYAVSQAAVTAHELMALPGELGRVDLPVPQGYAGVGGTGPLPGTGGSVGVGMGGAGPDSAGIED